MKINRIFPHFFSTGTCEDENSQAGKKSFDEILKEEQEKLMRLMSKVKNPEDINQLYHKFNPRLSDNPFFEE